MLDPSTGRSTAKEAGNKPIVQSHENLARKLQVYAYSFVMLLFINKSLKHSKI